MRALRRDSSIRVYFTFNATSTRCFLHQELAEPVKPAANFADAIQSENISKFNALIIAAEIKRRMKPNYSRSTSESLKIKYICNTILDIWKVLFYEFKKNSGPPKRSWFHKPHEKEKLAKGKRRDVYILRAYI